MTEIQQHRLRDSVRVVIEGLAGLAIAWMASTVSAQNTSITRLQVQVTQLQTTLADVPRMTRDLAQAQVQIGEHERRIGRLEDGSDKAKRWTR
jgi:hypothetical protein